MIDSNAQLLTVIDEYLHGRLSLAGVESWAVSQDETTFDEWEAGLFSRLETGLIEIGAAVIAEAGLQAELRERLRPRLVAGRVDMRQPDFETGSTSQPFATPLPAASTQVIWHTESQRAFG